MSSRLARPPRFPGASQPLTPEKGFPDWAKLIAEDAGGWRQARESANGPVVLLATNTGMHGAVATLDSVLGVALTLRGARVRYVLCDGVLQGCLMATYSDKLPPSMIAERGLVGYLCKGCLNRGTRVFGALDLPVHRLSDQLKDDDYKAVEAEVAALPGNGIESWAPDGLPLGEHAWAGALRYYARGDLENEPLGETVARRYAEGAALTARAYARILEAERPDVGVLHHAIYSPQGVAAEILRRAGARIAAWVVAYRKNCFIFSHDATYHHTLISEPTSHWENLALNAEQEAEISAYLASRASGGRDWIYFHKESGASFANFADARGIDRSKPLITALTNVMWDAQLHYPMNVFSGMKEWLVETVRFFATRPDLQLLIRVHPAELRGAIVSRQRVSDELAAAFPKLPPNVFLAGPEADVDSYAACAASNAVIIYGTKMGVELAPLGAQIIVAGEAWIRGKGLTHDARTKAHYFETLGALPFAADAPKPDRKRALAYAYHFFFRRMTPLPFLQPNGTGAMFGLEINKLDDLRPGEYPGLDIICDGIMQGAPFVYPAEVHGLHDRAP
jgi:hypothetical protein